MSMFLMSETNYLRSNLTKSWIRTAARDATNLSLGELEKRWLQVI